MSTIPNTNPQKKQKTIPRKITGTRLHIPTRYDNYPHDNTHNRLNDNIGKMSKCRLNILLLQGTQ